MKANADKLQAVTMKMNDSGRLKMSVTLICNDPAGAGVIKSILNRSLKDFENLLNVRGSLALRQVGPLPSEAEYERIFTATRKMVSTMQVFSADNKVSASTQLEPAIAMRGIYGFFGYGRNERRWKKRMVFLHVPAKRYLC